MGLTDAREQAKALRVLARSCQDPLVIRHMAVSAVKAERRLLKTFQTMSEEYIEQQ